MYVFFVQTKYTIIAVLQIDVISLTNLIDYKFSSYNYMHY